MLWSEWVLKALIFYSNALILLLVLIFQNQVKYLNVVCGPTGIACFSILMSHLLNLFVSQPCWSTGSCIVSGIVSYFPIHFSLFFPSRFIRNILKEALPNSFSVGGSGPFWYTHCAYVIVVHIVICVLSLVDCCFLRIGIMSYYLICLS